MRDIIDSSRGLLKSKYNILGADIAGLVEAFGNDVKRFRLDNEVFGDISGRM